MIWLPAVNSMVNSIFCVICKRIYKEWIAKEVSLNTPYYVAPELKHQAGRSEMLFVGVVTYHW